MFNVKSNPMRKIIVLLFLPLFLDGQTFLKYYNYSNFARGIYFYKENGYWMENMVSSVNGNTLLLHINDNGDSISSFFLKSENIYPVNPHTFYTFRNVLNTGNMDSLIVEKVDSSGVTAIFNIVDTGHVAADEILFTSDSSFLLTGNEDFSNQSYTHIYKTDTLGNIKWEKRILLNPICSQNTISMQETPNHDYLLFTYHACCCMSYPGSLYITRLDSAGNILWSKYRTGDWTSFKGQMFQTSAGDIMVIGDDSIVRLSSAGNVLWAKPNRTPGYIYSNITPAITTGFYACGILYDSLNEILITRFNDNGDSLSSFTFTGNNDLYPEYMEQLPNGAIACIGSQLLYNPNQQFQPFFLVCDSNGLALSADEALSSSNELQLFPNPVVTSIHLNKNISHSTISIIDIFGNEIYKYHSNEFHESIDVSDLAAGIYFLEINGPDNGVFKFIKY
jgi:hypothetical protein